MSEDYNESPAFGAIVQRLNTTGKMSSLIAEHGIDSVYEAIEDAASIFEEFDELGSSDVSILVNRVENSLLDSYKPSGLSV